MNMHIGWPQAIMLAIMFVTVLAHGIKHGQARQYHVGGAIIDFILTALVLWWGGFFGK